MMTGLPEIPATNDSFVFPEQVYRREFKKIRHALISFDRLSEQTQEWAREAKLRFIERESVERPGTLEIIGRIDSLPPVEDWWFQAKDAFGNLREALDQLNHNVYRFVSGEEPGLIRFPMATRGAQWRDWRKSAYEGNYPTWLIARYKRFQPYSTRRPMLTTLEQISNREKHRDGVAVALSLAEADFGETSYTVTPALSDDFEVSNVESASPPLIDLNSREFRVVEISIPEHTLSVNETELKAQFNFQFVLRVDGEEIPLDGAVRHITGEVLWAASHIVGRELNGDAFPSTLDLSLSGD
ncbi:hypothetical protein K7H02_03875 [Agromyces mediolanus]|nr:hypothetical protein [Agromyces mediolanus]